MRRSVCVIAEDVSLPLDEGIKTFAYSLILSWQRENRALGISVRSAGKIRAGHTIGARANRCFLSPHLWAISRRFHAAVVCYVPSASATLSSFLRCGLLKRYWPHASIVMVSLQPRRYGRLARRLIRMLAPDIVFVQDEATMKLLQSLGCHAGLLPSGVDLERFKPVTASAKVELRRKYRLDTEAFTVLHVGHIKTERNIELLVQARQRYNAQVILVGSSLPDKERKSLADRLREQGVIVMDKYIKDVQEIYQLSDCYLFPVFSEGACIGTPLSVLEAMACNLPVVTVKFGALPGLFKEGQGLFYAESPEGLLLNLGGIHKNNGYQTRGKVLPYSWDNIANHILTQSEVH
jgi:glycosyltransferase involved in cell wall biosynthesis